MTAGQQAALQRGKVLMKQFPEIWGLYHDFGVIGKHGDIRPDLWVRGAAQIFPQLNRIIDHVSPGYKVNTLNIDEGLIYFNHSQNYEKVVELGNALNSCGSDKARHAYHTAYTYFNI